MSQLDSRLLVRLASITAGRPAGWPMTGADGADERASALALEHGLLSLLDYRQRTAAQPVSIPQGLAELAHTTSRQQLMIDAIQADAINHITRALETSGVCCVLLKGVALGWSLYPHSWTRPRQDTDLLIKRADLHQAREVLRNAGYEQVEAMHGESIFAQESWTIQVAADIKHEIDLHLQLTNSHAFNRAVDPASIIEHRLALPALGEFAYAPSRPHALLHAAIHRVAHHGRSNRLIWLYDIQLLVDAMTSDEIEAVIKLAQSADLVTALTDGIHATQEWFGSEATTDLIAQLQPLQSQAKRELTREVTLKGAGRLAMFIADFKALPGLGARLQFIRENLFPPEAWLRKHFGRSGEESLARPFLRRLFRGLASLRS